jgi:hypothetical protein
LNIVYSFKGTRESYTKFAGKKMFIKIIKCISKYHDVRERPFNFLEGGIFFQFLEPNFISIKGTRITERGEICAGK